MDAEPFPGRARSDVGADGVVRGVTATAADAVPPPTVLKALRLIEYSVPLVSPVIDDGDEAPPEVTSVQFNPLSVVYWYLVIASPPVAPGVNAMDAEPFPGVANSDVGASGEEKMTSAANLLVPFLATATKAPFTWEAAFPLLAFGADRVARVMLAAAAPAGWTDTRARPTITANAEKTEMNRRTAIDAMRPNLQGLSLQLLWLLPGDGKNLSNRRWTVKAVCNPTIHGREAPGTGEESAAWGVAGPSRLPSSPCGLDGRRRRDLGAGDHAGSTQGFDAIAETEFGQDLVGVLTKRRGVAAE